MFKALQYFKPVIANNNGYIGYLVKKFNLGETCNIYNPISVMKVLKKFEEKKNYNNKVLSIHKFKKEYNENSFYKKLFVDIFWQQNIKVVIYLNYENFHPKFNQKIFVNFWNWYL